MARCEMLLSPGTVISVAMGWAFLTRNSDMAKRGRREAKKGRKRGKRNGAGGDSGIAGRPQALGLLEAGEQLALVRFLQNFKQFARGAVQVGQGRQDRQAVF